jgi:hypothetical protein
MADSNENTSEQRDFENDANADGENTYSAFDDMLKSYRIAGEAFRFGIQGANTSNPLQRAANPLGSNSVAEAFAKVSRNLAGISDEMKKLSPPQLTPIALKVSAELSQQQQAIFELQKKVIPSSATIAAAARLVATGEKTQKMLEWLNNPTGVSDLLETLNTISQMNSVSAASRISALHAVSENMLSAQKFMGAGLAGLVNTLNNTSSMSLKSDEETE